MTKDCVSILAAEDDVFTIGKLGSTENHIVATVAIEFVAEKTAGDDVIPFAAVDLDGVADGELSDQHVRESVTMQDDLPFNARADALKAIDKLRAFELHIQLQRCPAKDVDRVQLIGTTPDEVGLAEPVVAEHMSGDVD